MQEPPATTHVSVSRKVRPSIDIVITTVLTMLAVFLLSQFSVISALAIGSFAGFCAAAWNWFRMGWRRKAFLHLFLGLGIYLLFSIGNVLLLMLTAMLSDTLVPILVLTFDFSLAVLVIAYLYRATIRDVQKIQADGETIENYNFFPLLGVAGLSVIFVLVASTLVNQVRIAQLQNYVYCELLQPGMTRKEVHAALDRVGSHLQGWPEDTPYPALYEKAASYDVILWDDAYIERNYDLSIWLGYDENGQLVWRGRHWLGASEESFDDSFATIECPWTFHQSVTAR